MERAIKTIAVIGLGLIGGSFAKALSVTRDYTVIGWDRDDQVTASALEDGSISASAQNRLNTADLCVIGLYPQDTVRYVKDNLTAFRKNAIIMDLCGVKRYIHTELEPLCAERNLRFIGGHPMAGREVSGYMSSSADLFKGASYILTNSQTLSANIFGELKDVLSAAGFTKIIESTPTRHDEIIAYTSQLAHVVSSAYVKSPAADSFDGYSAGSFRDLTRVAKLNEHMWSELFDLNRDFLANEIGEIISHLTAYKHALVNRDTQKLKELLKDGSDIKKRLESESN